jgi:trehalose 6-phosphate synthase
VTIVVSNRGPFRFTEGPGGLATLPSPGGLASSLRPLLTSGAAGAGASWIAAALDDGDRAAAKAGAVEAPGITLRMLAFDPELYRLANDVVANQTLWFLHHGLFDLPRAPTFTRHFAEAWAAFEAVNRGFADAVVETAAPDDVVLVQDYQLVLVPGMIRERRRDLRIVHFCHIPFCGPNSVRVLPSAASGAICASLAGVPTGFHAARWAGAFQASARDVLGADAAITSSFVAPLGPDPAALEDTLNTTATTRARRELDDLIDDRAMLLRVDRIDPSKNIVRGFVAFDLLLEAEASWRGGVVFVAKLNESRQTVPEYARYAAEVTEMADRVNARWGTTDWTPIVLDTRDDYQSAVAAFTRYDTLLVNPIKDGLNLVAKEGPLLNTHDGVLCLSPDAGAWDELGAAALRAHPYDVEQTAGALHAALSMDATERTERAARLRALAKARTPRDWLDDQLSAAARAS